MHLCYGCSLPSDGLWECEIVTKTLLLISISTNTHCPYVCDVLGSYISLVNDFIDLIILIDLLYQLTISTYKLIDYR